MDESPELLVSKAGAVAVVELCRPPDNYFDLSLVRQLANSFEEIERDPEIRSILLVARGRCFCAGARFSNADAPDTFDPASLYQEALRLFGGSKPVVAAIQGPAIGGGLGLALVADFRVAAPEARFSGNFVALGISPGFGLTYTLPRLLGCQTASLLLLTGRRVNGEEAVKIGLADMIAPSGVLRETALTLAAEIAAHAPLALKATRGLMRHGMREALEAHVAREVAAQLALFGTADHREGVRAVAERRPGVWSGT